MENHQTSRSVSTGRVRRGVVAFAATATALGSALTFAAPAGATSSLANPANSMIVGAGSATTYDVMTKLGTLFNAATSCDLYQPSTVTAQPQDFSCVVDANPTQTTPKIYGASVARTPVNPFADVVVNEPPVGSSTGIKILSNQGAKGAAGVTSGGQAISVANNVTFARSSRNLKSTDYQGLNFVAYARDGITWAHYASVGVNKATVTPSFPVTDMSKAQVANIFNGTIKNWSYNFTKTNADATTTTDPGSSAPIIVFSAQIGSGTWDSWGSNIGSTATYKTSDPTNPVNCYDVTDTSTCEGPAVIFENETADIKVNALQPQLDLGLKFGVLDKPATFNGMLGR